jgi:hypothetical protein
MVTINIQKKDLYLFGAILVFLIGTGAVIAIGSNNYQVQGHDFSELQKCSIEGQILKMSGGNWVCASDQGGGMSGYMCVAYCFHNCENGYAENVGIFRSGNDKTGTYPAGTYSSCGHDWCRDVVACTPLS